MLFDGDVSTSSSSLSGLPIPNTRGHTYRLRFWDVQTQTDAPQNKNTPQLRTHMELNTLVQNPHLNDVTGVLYANTGETGTRHMCVCVRWAGVRVACTRVCGECTAGSSHGTNEKSCSLPLSKARANGGRESSRLEEEGVSGNPSDIGNE